MNIFIEALILFTVSARIVDSKISLDINVRINANDVTITHSGFEVDIIGHREIELFNIGNVNIKKAVKRHYHWSPSDVYLKSPTPWGDLFQKYNWEQVSRVLTVKSARLKTITMKPLIVLSHDFDNVSNKTIKVNTGISQTVENTISTSWSKSKETTVSQEIEYDMNVMFAKMTGTTGFSYTTSWGESEERSETITIGTTSGVETELQPGQAVTAVLSANKGALEIEVVYLAKLRGNVAVNFKIPYKGHHFWGPSIDSVMKSGGLENEVIIKETINLSFYTDASLKVYDKISGLPL